MGSRNVHLVLQHSCKKSFIAMLRFLLTTNQTCVATNQVVADCDKVLQKVESSSTFRNEICTYCAFYRSEANLFCNK